MSGLAAAGPGAQAWAARAPSPPATSSKYRGVTRYKLRLSGKLALHAFEPRDVAQHRYTLEAEQYASLTPRWSLLGGFRAGADSAFATNPDRYGGQVTREETYEFSARDLYLQYKDDSYLIRIGNQQVVWGEAFGFFYADIVNPKDLRQFVLEDLESLRIPVPMVNARWVGASGALQLVYIPYPFFNRIPVQGSDFFSIAGLPAGSALTVNDSRTLPFELANGEAGAKVSGQLGEIDLSLLFFSYFDRQPAFSARVTSLSPLSISLDSKHHRIRTAGLTATTDIESVLIRIEALYTSGRFFDAVSNGTVSSSASDEALLVIEGDYGGVPDWRFGLQAAFDAAVTPVAGALFPPKHSVSAHVNRSLGREQAVDAIFTYVPADGSSLTRLEHFFPVSNALELRTGADLFLGGGASRFGGLRDASRGYIALRAYLGG